MALKLNERYPGRFNNPNADYPQGSFKNRTTPDAKDGSYLEKDWANDKEGFFQSLLTSAALVPNGQVDTAVASQYHDALVSIINSLVPAQVAHGQCRLTFVSATSIKLSPLNGRSLMIGGVPRQLPAAGISLANTGLSASTFYYIYAAWSGSAIILEASATGHSQDATTGVEIKTGDATRTLVGALQTNASTQFTDSVSARNVASYFNRRNRNIGVFAGSGITLISTSEVEVSTSLRLQFVSWGDEIVTIDIGGQFQVGLSQSIGLQPFVDGVAYGNRTADFSNTSATGMTFASTGRGSLPANTPLAEGFHTVTVVGAVTGSTGTVNFINHTGEVRQ